MGIIEELQSQIVAQNPTAEQQDAIFSGDLEFLLRAAPGSGKTWTSCRRFIWRGANWPYKVGGIALLSFTNTAIHEFYRATHEVGMQKLLSDPNYLGTFDAFLERFLFSTFGHLIEKSTKRPKLFVAARPGDWANQKLQAWTTLGSGQNIPVPAWEIVPFVDKEDVKFRASIKSGGKALDGASAVKELLRTGRYTHAQRGYWACMLLSTRPHLAKILARRFPEIIVDEAQDTNKWLLLILEILREAGSKITLIGDPDQCIFEFSMADPESLFVLREKWGISEKPLSKSFRCSNRIADAVRNIGTNAMFTGRGEDSGTSRKAYVVRETSKVFNRSIAEFQKLLPLCDLDKDRSAILCRGHGQLESIRGESIYAELRGQTQDLARAAFFRDFHHDYKYAFKTVESVVRKLSKKDDLWKLIDEQPDCERSRIARIAIWRFVKYPSGLPSIGLSAEDWIEQLKTNLSVLLVDIGIDEKPKLGLQIKKTGLEADQFEMPLFTPEPLFPTIRQETIHKVKGESLDAVLLLGTDKFFNDIVNSIVTNTNTEDRRLAYVGMTRARSLLVVGLPSKHYDKHIDKWKQWGFEAL